MRTMIVIIFIFSFISSWGISISLGRCIGIYTGSYIYETLFSAGSAFILALMIFNYLFKNFVKPILHLL